MFWAYPPPAPSLAPPRHNAFTTFLGTIKIHVWGFGIMFYEGLGAYEGVCPATPPPTPPQPEQVMLAGGVLGMHVKERHNKGQET